MLTKPLLFEDILKTYLREKTQISKISSNKQVWRTTHAATVATAILNLLDNYWAESEQTGKAIFAFCCVFF